MNNNNSKFPEGMDPETLDMINSIDHRALERLQQFENKFGARGMLETIRAETECPVDALIAESNVGSQRPKLAGALMKALAAAEVFIIYSNDQPCIIPTPRGLVVIVFTRESHVHKFIEAHISEVVTTKKVLIADLFLTVLPERYFTLHLNPEEGGGMFEMVLPPDMVDFLYNLSVHGEEATRRFCAETGKDPYQQRF